MGVLEAVLAEFFVRFAAHEDFCWSELHPVSFQRYWEKGGQETLTASVSMKSPRIWTFPWSISDDVKLCLEMLLVCEGVTGVAVDARLASNVDGKTSSECLESLSPEGST